MILDLMKKHDFLCQSNHGDNDKFEVKIYYIRV